MRLRHNFGGMEWLGIGGVSGEIHGFGSDKFAFVES